jgi:Flp pilus assembly protein TadG
MTHFERGSVSAFVTALLMGFISCVGLAVDGGRLVTARIELADHAENAARAGVQHVTSLRSGDPEVDVDEARRAAHRYLASQMVSGEVHADSGSVRVRTTRVVPLTVLTLIGMGGRLVSVERSASPVPGP